MFRVYLTTLVIMLTLLQLPSAHHNPSCDACARDAEETKENAKREFGRQT